MQRQLLFLEFNEVNFNDAAYYCERGLLPNLKALIDANGLATTRSELQYEQLEPWIQWVTAHTGMTLAEHSVFRLGDIVNHDLVQIWERIEERGLRVGALSPMNARHRLRDPAFFVPDPWTPTQITARPRLARLHQAIAQAVNDNAESRITARSLVHLLAGLISFARPANYAAYASLLATGIRRSWRKAILLDVLLADVFIREVRRTAPNFATLFLNAAAHIQHHYLFSAACYRGPYRNPEWYLAPGVDPVREVYEAYDRILGGVRAAFPQARIMIATGLHQDPHTEVTFYWRLRKHSEFLRRIRVPHATASARMSRDFVVNCESPEQALNAQRRLAAAIAEDGTALFSVDNRGTDLFVELTYPHEISAGFAFSIEGERFTAFDRDVAFVALKNGRHNGTGYFLDSDRRFDGNENCFELRSIPELIMEALGLDATVHA